jgi:hypothetical protein
MRKLFFGHNEHSTSIAQQIRSRNGSQLVWNLT